jgi:ComF family protein
LASPQMLPSAEAALRRSGVLLSGLGCAALDLLVPPHCSCCDEAVAASGLFCAACFSRAGFVTEPCCAVCGVMFAYAAQGGSDRLCPGCRVAPPVFSRARAPFRYDAHARRLILPFKHADRTENARILALHMARAGAVLLREADLLIPIPLHRRRLFRRRYNQAVLLAGSLAKSSGVPLLADGLIRHRPTVALGDKSAADRHALLNDVFEIQPSRTACIAGSRVLLIDDVMTSGATANACAAVLRLAGALDVAVLIAARVPDPRLS